MINLSVTYSYWWIFLCLLIGGGYAWIQYSKIAPWSKPLNYGLASIRWILVSFICFLFIEPYVQSITNFIEKPLFIIAVDNSESIALNATTEDLKELKRAVNSTKLALDNKGYKVYVVDLDGVEIEHIDSLRFTKNTTNLSNQFNAFKKLYSNFNLSGAVLFSDGIFNNGYSPLANTLDFPVFTIGMGDTIQIKDLSIKEVISNATVFEGNTLLVEVQVLNIGMGKVATEISAFNKGKKVASEPIVFNTNQTLVKAVLAIPIEGKGKQSIRLNLNPVAGEHTNLNNSSTIYFDVIDAQRKILILSSSPHPDIKAIKTSIESNVYYDVELAYKLPNKLDYELLIMHQYPSVNTSNQEKDRLLKSSIPKWLIIGSASDFNFLKARMNIVELYNNIGKLDAVMPLYNAAFDKFQLNDAFNNWITTLPPIYTPLGLVLTNSFSDVLLHQQIGNIATDQPLLVFNKQKEIYFGILLGTGLWRWKLDEYRNEQTHENFDLLISKTVQYLSSSPNKKRFYATPQKEAYEEGEEILFTTQQYNALFERIVGSKVELSIKNEKGESKSYSFVPLNQNSLFKVNGMPQGIYSYNATTIIDSVKYLFSGQFAVQKLNNEALNPVADYDLLRKLANKSGGSFYESAQINAFEIEIESLNPISIIHSSEKDEPLNNIKWVLLLLVLLATSEWFLRKFYGGY